jgi:uncharacterized coiled-coil protein SlyX
MKKKHPPMILPAHLRSTEKTVRVLNEMLRDIWIELARLARRLKNLRKRIDD